MPRRSKPASRLPQPQKWIDSPRIGAALVIAVILLCGLIRFRLRDTPLERDEGEYAYAGQLMLQGVPPYQQLYNMKLPGTYAAYAVILAIFGQSAAGVHLGLLLVNALTSWLVYRLAVKLLGQLGGVVAGMSYALLSATPAMLALQAHATHFVAFFAVGGLLALLDALENKKPGWFFCSGVLLGLAFVMKQPGLFFVAFGGLYLLLEARRARVPAKQIAIRSGVFFLGSAIPFLLTCAILWRCGILAKFWFWTFDYARAYGSQVSWFTGFQNARETIVAIAAPVPLLWPMAVAGAIALWWSQLPRSTVVFCAGFVVVSFLAVCPGLYFRQHYFIVLLPSVSLLIGISVSATTMRLGQRDRWTALVPSAVFLVATVAAIWGQRSIFFQQAPVQVSRTLYSINPFPEALQIAAYIRDHTEPGERIAVLGSELEIFFYAKRHSATGYIYTYALMDERPYASTMQQEMIEEIEAARPAIMVLVNVPYSWLPRPGSDRHILNWADAFLRDHYDVVGVADLQSQEHTEYVWGATAGSYQPQSPYVVYVLRRRSA